MPLNNGFSNAFKYSAHSVSCYGVAASIMYALTTALRKAPCRHRPLPSPLGLGYLALIKCSLQLQVGEQDTGLLFAPLQSQLVDQSFQSFPIFAEKEKEKTQKSLQPGTLSISTAKISCLLAAH